MADRTVDILLVGGGIASATAAHTLREQGFDGSILLVGREPHPPYHRPPASKEYLRGEHGPEDAHVHPADWWEPNGVELLTRTSVLDLDTEARTAKLSTKEEVGFDRALIATGRDGPPPAASTAPSSRACTTCARSATPTASARSPRAPSASSASAAPTSPPRWPPR